MPGTPGKVTVKKLETEHAPVSGAPDDFARDVRAGLTAVPKDLSPWPKYFYDARGSEIFEEITAQPEYYQTRTELSILEEYAEDLVSRSGCRELVELGSGSSSKTRTLLDAMLALHSTNQGNSSVRYVPMDVSENAVEESVEKLGGDYPDLEVSGFVGDFDHSLKSLLQASSGEASDGRLVIFLGGTIGNFTPERREEFLCEIRSGLRTGEHLLVGVDLVKDREVLEAAYADRAGVTARFNKNLLCVLNERLGGGFDPESFSHRAVFDAEHERIEMWLDSDVDQEVYLPGLDLTVPFEAGEGMRTEISAKFTRDSARKVFADTGFSLANFYTDERDLFALALAVADR